MPAGFLDDALSPLQLLELLPQLAWIATADGTPEYWNLRFREYTGVELDRAGGLRWGDIVHPDDLALIERPGGLGGAAAEAAIRLRRADGAYRIFILRTIAIDGGEPRWFGSAIDIDDRRRQEVALRFLADAGGILSATTDISGRLARLMQHAVASIADMCIIFTADAREGLHVGAMGHIDPEAGARFIERKRRFPLIATDPRRVVAATRRPLLLSHVPVEMHVAIAHNAAHLEHLKTLPLRSMLIVPLVTSGRLVGVMQMTTFSNSRALDGRDLQLAEALAERVAVAIDNAIDYARERHASLVFQHAALPRALPAMPGVELRAVYTASEAGAEVGGDWYDAFVLPQGMLALSIGDVAGHGIEAAAQMSVVRQAIRVAMLQGLDPARALRTAELALQSEGADRLVTAFVARFDPTSSTLTYAIAGHPAPVLRAVDGSVHVLDADPAPPLGATDARKPPSKRTRLVPGDLLVLYTDGLIEADRDPIAGERRLIEVARDDALEHAADPAAFIRDAVLTDGARDDVAILTMRLSSPLRWSFACDDALAATGARAAFVAHLRRHAAAESDIPAAELVFGELVGNVVRYAPGPLDIALGWDGPAPVLHLIDRGPGYDVAAAAMPEDPLAENGRGIFLCSLLGKNFTVRPHAASGSHSRIELPVLR